MQSQQIYTCLFKNIPKKILNYAFSICDELHIELTHSKEFLTMLNLPEITFEVEHKNPDVIYFADYLIQQKIEQINKLENTFKLELEDT